MHDGIESDSDEGVLTDSEDDESDSGEGVEGLELTDVRAARRGEHEPPGDDV